MKLHYLEIVTENIDEACGLYSTLYGVTFGEADQKLGNARTASFGAGGKLGVRAPMHDAEAPVVRPYMRVDDIASAVASAGKLGATVAMPPTEIEGYGQFAIIIQGGIESGLWQV